MAGIAANTHVLLPNEAELFIQNLDTSILDQVGNKGWWLRHETLEKLNIQAVLNTTANCDDYVREHLLSHKKIPLLVSELIISELWSERIFPHVLKKLDMEQSTLPVYMVLFHEATIAGLLETMFYYQEVCEESGDSVLDLIDFINRKLTQLIQKTHEKKDKENLHDLQIQNNEIQFTVEMKALSILRYISDAMDILPLSAITRLLNTHDMACVLVQILDIAPWRRKKKNGEIEIYADGKWVTVPKDEMHLLSKLEGQVWLTLYQLLMHPEAQRKYEYNTYRKTQILKLRKYLHEVLLDQLPYLAEMQRFLENLSVMEPPQAKQELIIEQIPEIRSKFEDLYNGKWEKIASQQMKECFTLDEQQLREQAQRLAATYDLDILESLIEEPPVCANCQGEATKRCSRCQNEWYCTRQCQVKHWKKHKELCNLLAKKES